MLKKINILFVAILLLTLSGCDLSDITDPKGGGDDDELGSSISYKVDGELIQGTFGDDTILELGTLDGKVVKSANSTGISITSGLIKNNKAYAIALILTTNKKFSDLEPGDSFLGNIKDISQLTIAAFGIEHLVNGTEFSSTSGEEELVNQNLRISITKIDYNTNRISGTFSFDAYDPELKLIKKITEGEFTNVILKE